MLDLEGLWTRYEDPTPLLAEIADARRRARDRPHAGDLRGADPARADHRAAPGDPRARASRSPAPCRRSARSEFWRTVVDAGVDLFVIRGTTVSAEHVSGRAEPLNLKRFIYELDVPVIVGGASTYTAALHLMRTGAAGVLVGFGGGAAHTTRAVARHPRADGDRGRRRRGRAPRLPRRVRRPVRARHRRRRRRALRRPGQGRRVRRGRRHARRGARAGHRGARARLALGPRGAPPAAAARRAGRGGHGRARSSRSCSGPGRTADGTLNLVGALRRAMATTGYSDLKEFQRVEVVVSPVPAALTAPRAAARPDARRARRRRARPGVCCRRPAAVVASACVDRTREDVPESASD